MSERKPLPLRDITIEELQAAHEEAAEDQRILHEQFREILTITPEVMTMGFQ